MPNFHHPLRYCTTARYDTTIPSRICNTDPTALQVQEHFEDQAKHVKYYADKCSKQLAPFYAGQPIATIDTMRKIWIPATVVVSFQRKATKYALQMEPSTAIPDASSRNTVSNAMMLSQRPYQPHWNRLTAGFPDPCQSLPQLLNEYHNQLHL